MTATDLRLCLWKWLSTTHSDSVCLGQHSAPAFSKTSLNSAASLSLLQPLCKMTPVLSEIRTPWQILVSKTYVACGFIIVQQIRSCLSVFEHGPLSSFSLDLFPSDENRKIYGKAKDSSFKVFSCLRVSLTNYTLKKL